MMKFEVHGASMVWLAPYRLKGEGRLHVGLAMILRMVDRDGRRFGGGVLSMLVFLQHGMFEECSRPWAYMYWACLGLQPSGAALGELGRRLDAPSSPLVTYLRRAREVMRHGDSVIMSLVRLVTTASSSRGLFVAASWAGARAPEGS
jgi:hypothetical protein